ncbi:MAG: DUF2141 domain-containing protein [Candidatus Thiodiazotropha sp. (ex Epidulcina cf. delphinae)]|nr:DUF2141 domain-containing protein [Candidatus Thiodiazotropha sp. (ex Epidulcina cf. delphinae)]
MMKKPLKTLVFLILIIATIKVYPMETKPVTLEIKDIERDRGGQIVVFVFSAQGFPKQHEMALWRYKAPVEQRQMKIDIEVPAREAFALKVLHDENLDEKVTKNWTGIFPKDGIGFSNGARIRFGVPDYKDAKISYTSGLSPVISLQYF